MNYIKDLKLVYGKALEETIIRIKKNPLVLILPLIFSALISLINKFFGSFVSVGSIYVSFLVPVLYALVLSVYYDMLSDVMYYNRLGVSNLNSSFRRYFGPIYSVYFVLIMISWLSLALFRTNYILNLIMWLAIFIIFNPIVETIYLKDESYLSAYSYCANFMKENFVHWLIPLAIYMGIQALLGFSLVEFITDKAIIVLPVGRSFSLNILNFGPTYIIKYLLVEILTGFYIIFRGNLFKILSTGTMRKRQYMGEL